MISEIYRKFPGPGILDSPHTYKYYILNTKNWCLCPDDLNIYPFWLSPIFICNKNSAVSAIININLFEKLMTLKKTAKTNFNPITIALKHNQKTKPSEM